MLEKGAQRRKLVKTFFATVLMVAFSVGARAQVPHILGNWQLNVTASKLGGPAPRVHVRRYSLADDGVTLIGLAVVVDTTGTPHFLQFAAKDDGKDTPEFDSGSLAAYQMHGTMPRGSYAETPVDSHTVEWVDKYDGRVVGSGRKWVSEDGRTLSFTVHVKNPQGEDLEFLYVFDRLDPPAPAN